MTLQNFYQHLIQEKVHRLKLNLKAVKELLVVHHQVVQLLKVRVLKDRHLNKVTKVKVIKLPSITRVTHMNLEITTQVSTKTKEPLLGSNG